MELPKMLLIGGAVVTVGVAAYFATQVEHGVPQRTGLADLAQETEVAEANLSGGTQVDDQPGLSEVAELQGGEQPNLAGAHNAVEEEQPGLAETARTEGEEIPNLAGATSVELATRSALDAAALLGAERYVGVWNRRMTYIDGRAEQHAPGTLTLTKETFASVTTCPVSGNLSVTGNTMRMAVTRDGCTGGRAPKHYSQRFALSLDGRTLTLTMSMGGSTMKEVYERQ